MKKSLMILMILGSFVALSGCNTVAGFGQDLKKGSEHVSEALGKVGDSMTQKANSHQQ